MYNRKFFTFFTSCLMLVQTLFAQIVIQGTVTDNGAEYLGNGAEPVSSALVRFIDQADSNRSFSSYTNEQGQYSVQITGVENISLQKFNGFRLLQNYPNPFNPSTVIRYEIPQPSHVKIKVFNVLGQSVKNLLDDFQYGSGSVVWTATDNHNHGVPAGLYIYSMTAGDVRINKKMLLIDGHMGGVATATTFSSAQINSDQNFLNKQLSDKYTLRITGNDIETYEQENISLDGDFLDVAVNRTVTDIDGNVCKTVKIGNQWWMAENLKVTHYRNGDPIPNVTSSSEWTSLSTGAYFFYDTCCYIYNWYAVDDSRNIAPTGWHIPTDEEWKQLEMYLGMSQSEANDTDFRGTNEGSKMAGNASLWNGGSLENNAAFGESGLSALPGDFRASTGHDFSGYNDVTFWSSTEDSSSDAWSRALYYKNSGVSRDSYPKRSGVSVRCVKDTVKPKVPLTVATVSMGAVTDTEANLQTFFSYMEEAAEQGAHLIVFPEIALQQNPGWGKSSYQPTQEELDYVLNTAETIPGESTERVVEKARELHLYVVFGMTEKVSDEDNLYNASVFVGPDGIIGKYRKMNLWNARGGGNEHLFWKPGKKFGVFNSPLGKVGLMICADMFFDVGPALARKGAELLVAVAGWKAYGGGTYELKTVANAVDANRWLVISNQVGSGGHVADYGHSRVISPDGDIVADTGTEEGMVIVEIDYWW
jgi:uncharacterized protein (TIGR02145 family)